MSWTGDVAGCPDEEQLLDRVRAARKGEMGQRRALTARGRVSRLGEGQLELDLRISGPELENRRSLRAPDCDALAQAAVLLIALALDAEPPAAGRQATGAHASTAPTTTGPRDDPQSSGSDAPRSETTAGEANTQEANGGPAPNPTRAGDAKQPAAREEAGAGVTLGPLELALGVQVMLATLMLPASPALGPGLQLEARLAPLRLRAGGFWLPYQSADAATSGAARVEADARLLSLSACYAASHDSLALVTCGVGQWGRLHARGRGLSSPEAGALTWLAAGASVEFALQIKGPLEAHLGAALLLPHQRMRLRLGTPAGERTAFEADAAAVQTMLGFAYVFR